MVRHRPLWMPALLVALMAGLAGCAGLGPYREAVRVTVSDIRVLEAGMLEQLYGVTLRIQNPNADPLPVRGGSFQLAINGRDFASGVTADVVTVPPFGDAKINVRMVSTLFGMLRLFEGFQDRRETSLQYDISGRLALEGSYSGLSFHTSGELNLPRPPDPGAVP